MNISGATSSTFLDLDVSILRASNDAPYQSPSIQTQTVTDKLLIQGIDFQLQKLLESEAIGRALIIIHGCGCEFTSTCQTYLVDIIVLFFLNKNA